MVEFLVKYRLYNSAGTGLIYTFPLVQEDSSPQDSKDYVEIQGLRGQGSIVIPGSTTAWNLTLRFLLQGEDYAAVIALVDALESTILLHAPYVLKIDRTSSTTKNYNVMRLEPFSFSSDDFRTEIIEATATLRVNSW